MPDVAMWGLPGTPPNVRWFVLGERPCVSHDCIGGRVVATLPFPMWKLVGNPPASVTPSFHCTACGTHVWLNETNSRPRGEAT